MGKQQHAYEPVTDGKETMPSCSCMWVWPGEAFDVESEARREWEKHAEKSK